MNSLWFRISNLGAQENESKEYLRRIHLVNRMCFIATFTTFVFLFHLFAVGCIFYAKVQALCGLLALVFIFLSSKRLYRLSLYWVFFLILLNVFYCSLEVPGSGVEYFYIPLSMVLLVMEENVRNCFFTAFLCFTAFCTSHFIRKTYVPHEHISDLSTEIIYFTVLFFVFLICFFIILQFKVVYGIYEKIIHQQKEMVEDRNKEITESLRYARRIQRSLLPPENYIEKTLKRLKK